MTTAFDILTLIRERAPDGEGVALKISQIILQDPEYVVDISIKSLAERLGVSEPSIIRYCRDMGCLGFKDFKKRLAQSLVLDERFAKSGEVARDESSEIDGDERLSHARSGVISAISAVSTTDHFRRIDLAAKALVSGGYIIVMGVGGSSALLAQEAQNRLFRLELRVVTHSDGYMQQMSAATLKNGDILFVISSTGKPSSLIESLKIAKSAGAVCIAIAPGGSPVAALADITIPIELDRNVPFQRPNPARYAQLFVLDNIAERAALLLGKSAADSLRRITAVLAPLLDLDSHQPLGD